MSSPSKKTSTITFRIDDEIIKNLKVESGKRQVSTNVLVNQALKGFLEWDIYQPLVGFVLINKKVFTTVFSKMNQAEVVDIASKVGKNEVRDIALFMGKGMNLLSFLSWFELRMINSSVQVSHTVEDTIHTYMMRHDIGKNWSIYHKIILEIIFQEVFKKKIQVKAEKSMISFQLSE